MSEVYLDPYYLPAGWETLCLSLDNDIQQLVAEGKVENFSVVQLKEKYGEMRLYFTADKGYDELEKLIDDYAYISANTCALCGAQAVYQSEGWILPYCDACSDKKDSRFTKYRTMPQFNPMRTVIRYKPDGTKYEQSYDTSYVLERIDQYGDTHEIQDR